MAQPSPPASPPAPRWQNLHDLLAFIRPHRRKLLLGFLFGFGTTVTSLVTPMATKWVIDGLGDNSALGMAVALLAVLLVLGAVFAVFQWILLGTMAEQVVYEARTKMVRQLFRSKVGELTKRPSGELVASVTSDTTLLRQAASTSVVDLINGIIALIGGLVLMATLDWVLLLITAGVIAVVAVAIAVLSPRMAQAQQQAQDAIGRLGGSLDGALRAIRTVKSSRAENRESKRILAEAGESRDEAVRAVRIEATTITVANAGMRFAIMVVLALGALRVGAGDLTVSALVAFLLYAFQISEPVTAVTTTVSQLQSGFAAAARIRQVTSLPAEMPDETPAVDAPVSAGANGSHVLAFQNVTARYAPGADPVLTGVSLDIARTGHTAIVGPSGAGKTTMFSLMLKFLHPDGGDLTLDGVPFSQLSIEDVRKRIVYVEQDAPLLPGTMRENLRYTHPDADEDALWAALRTVRMDERVRAMPEGLDSKVSGTAVSGGERQRIALARALVTDPEILLLDEATAQLDGLTESAVQEAISRIAAKGAVVTIAHRLSTVIDADQIVLMDKGRCRARGTHAELFDADELYRELVLALRIQTITPSAADLADEQQPEIAR
ncbi:ABC transporter ATP-binding protein [Kutzneria sp. NPDC052558]|uniref:ABC transporter ATP-binding protein n=1 Tax=Kutzneria sp. NPDC052558 TaxID=3364121 RepID=UPI0037C60071